MFDFSANRESVEKNSDLVNPNKREAVKFNSNILINSPALLTKMSHEMRTHMNAIVAFSFLLKENGCQNSENEEYSNQILRSCEQLIGLFDSFLDTALIDTGNINSDLKICNLDTFLDELLSEFREILQKEGHQNLELIVDIQDTNSTEVSIDTNRVFRVVQSLFQNAIRTTKSGYIKIGYSFRDDNLLCHILDSGNGYFNCREFLMTEDMNVSLTQHNDPYTAINIALARKLIQFMGGTIRVERNDLSGTGVYFSFPVKRIINPALSNNYAKSIMAT